MSITASTLAHANEQDAQNSQDSPNTLTIGGRPEAPLIEPHQLPWPSWLQAPASPLLEPLHPVDLLMQPELLMFDEQETFLVDLNELQKDLAKASGP